MLASLKKAQQDSAAVACIIYDVQNNLHLDNTLPHTCMQLLFSFLNVLLTTNMLWKINFIKSNQTFNYHGIIIICFTSDHHTLCSLIKVRRHVIGWISHDIVVGLCFKLLMRLSYFIHLPYGDRKKIFSITEVKPTTF